MVDINENESFIKLLERDKNLLFRYDDRLNRFLLLNGNLAELTEMNNTATQSAGIQFLNEYSDLFGDINTDDIKFLRVFHDQNGGINLEMQQYYAGYKVHGGTIQFHVTKDKILNSISNSLFPDLNKLSTEPKITEEQAIQIAKEGTNSQDTTNISTELVVYRHDGNPHLVWEVHLNESYTNVRKDQAINWFAGEHGAPHQWIVFVDAINGDLLLYYDNLKTIGPTIGHGMGYYFRNPHDVNTWFNGTTYQLRDTSRTTTQPIGPEIITNDQNGTFPAGASSPSEDIDNNWNDLATSPRLQNQGAEIDSHIYISKIVDYYKTVHNRNSIDGNGGNITSLIHCYNNWNNAAWDGRYIQIGDGSGQDTLGSVPGFDYMSAYDVIAHEFTHGVTDVETNLFYVNEPGALDEAISDIFAAFITGDWLIGEDCWLRKITAPALRNMRDPTNGGKWKLSEIPQVVWNGHQPSHYDFRYTGGRDNGGVHINSGIINNLFYLLTMGGTHSVSNITVNSIGQQSVEQMLYLCLTSYIRIDTAFLEFRETMLRAWQTLFPTDLYKLTQIKNAFNAVGIGSDLYIRDSISDNGEEPTSGENIYSSPDIINRTIRSPNPDVEFANLNDDSLSQNIKYGQDNYIYIRLQNRGNQRDDGAVIDIYFVEATTFATPSSWIFINQIPVTGILPRTLKIVGPVILRSSRIPQSGHYCLVAVVRSFLDPAPNIRLITSQDDFVNYVRNSNNIAWRNVIIQTFSPDMRTTNTFKVLVQTLPGIRERYDLEIDTNNFVPLSKIYIRGPRNVMDGSIIFGLKLISHDNNQNVYELISKYDSKENYQEINSFIGFKNILVDSEFHLDVEYIITDEALTTLNYIAKDDYTLNIRQIWNGKSVGAVSVKLLSIKNDNNNKENS